MYLVLQEPDLGFWVSEVPDLYPGFRKYQIYHFWVPEEPDFDIWLLYIQFLVFARFLAKV